MKIIQLRCRSGFAKRAVTAFLSIASSAASAQSYHVLYSFAGGKTDGATPHGAVTLVGNTLYGTTSAGGGSGFGTIFSYSLSSKTESLVHSFSGMEFGDGNTPWSTLTGTGPILYGTTEGNSDLSTVFSLDTTTGVVTTHLMPGEIGAHVYGSLHQSGTMMYGLAAGGGGQVDGHYSSGSIFQFDTRTNGFSLLHQFAGGSQYPSSPDGSQPHGSLIQSGSTLYGMTTMGGTASYGFNGVAFAFDTQTNVETIIHSFPYASRVDGSSPMGSLVQSGYMLYGMTLYGGASSGTLFAIDTRDNSETAIHEFGDYGNNGFTYDGVNPFGSLIAAGNMLYGMVTAGGDTGRGIIYSYDTTTGTYTELHSFEIADGAFPYGDLMLSGDTLYGMTSAGGDNNQGVIFALSVPEPTTFLLPCILLCAARRRRKK